MPTTRLTLPDHWDATGRITATEDTAIMITETEGKVIYWALTTDETTEPGLFEADGHRIDGFGQQPMILKTAKRFG